MNIAQVWQHRQKDKQNFEWFQIRFANVQDE